MGLERMATILQGVDNIYEIDTMWKVLDRAAELTEQKYGRDHRADVALRVVADHVRTAVMLVADGVLPSNEGRGYVLRRILRRRIRNLRLLAGGQRGERAARAARVRRGEQGERYLHELTAAAIDALGEQFPELRRDAARITAVIEAEEAAFSTTLRTGSAIFDAAVGEVKRRGTGSLTGEQAFQLHDTYGFPIDLTLEMAAEQGLTVDEEGFRRLMAEQRERAKEDAVEKKTGNADVSVLAAVLERSGPVHFTGYDQVTGEATVTGLLVDGASVPAAGAGTEVEVVLDRTPFYAEGGGQLADTGVIRVSGSAAGGGVEVEVHDVQSPVPGLIVHRGKVVAGEIVVGDPAQAEIDIERRRAVSRSHTATHLVHRAIRNALGDSAAQAGSENAPGRLRFDFTAAGAVPVSVLRDVEDEVNDVLVNDLDVRAFVTPHRGGTGDRRDRAVRREVRRPGPGGRDRRLLARAVRRHARGQVGPARPGQAARGVVDRLRRAAGRGAGRHGRVPVPRHRARAGEPAGRAVQGAAGRSCPSGWRRWSPGSGTPSGSSAGSAPLSCLARPRN